jgi:hypothetical protein
LEQCPASMQPPLAGARSDKVRDAPQVPRTCKRRTPTGRCFSANYNKDKSQGRATWEWSWSNVRKPDTRFPPVSRLITRALGAARCFSRAPVVRSAAPITRGLRGKPGSTSRASGSRRRSGGSSALRWVQSSKLPALTWSQSVPFCGSIPGRTDGLMMCRGGRSKGAMIVKLAATSAASADAKMVSPPVYAGGPFLSPDFCHQHCVF